MLQVRGLAVEVGGRPVLEDAGFSVHAGDKVGLVGRNGVGKTSLLKVVAGEAQPLRGAISRQGGLGYLPQDPRLSGIDPTLTAVSHVLAGRGLDDAPGHLERLRLKIQDDPSRGNIARFSRAEEQYRDAGGYSAEAEARRIAAGLGLARHRLDLPVKVLSGGERRRVELARILFAGSDLLLLDEPTNHLDTDAKSWLMRFLASYRGALVVVSHDLNLLDASITRVMHLEDGVLIEYKGTYSQYLAARERDEARLGQLAQSQAREIARLADLANSMRGQTAKRARVAKNLDGRAARLAAEQVRAPAKRRALALRFPPPPTCSRTVLAVIELWKSFGSLDVFADVSFDVGRGERLLVMGLNGAGKTTLLKILADRLASDLGEVEIGTHVSLGYYAQEHEGITVGRSLLEHMRDASSLGDGGLRNLMGMFGLGGDKVFQDAGTLSGGEKTKLALAQLVAGQHNLLVLDEPTNNLDPMSRAATGEALAAWPGTMIVVSHDVEFVRALAPDRALLMPDGTLDYFDDEMLDLLELV